MAAWPAFLAIAFGRRLFSAAAGTIDTVSLAWAPSLGLSLSFTLDGLGLLFATLITGIGALVVLYASHYLDGHPQAPRFYATLFAFMGAMLGVSASDNVLALFVFWELTGFTSFLLIGFDHDRPAARAAALQALIVTGAGGLALLGAAVLLIDIGGTVSLSALASSHAAVIASPLYPAIAVLVLLAAFTKSAQFPFHFWLPGAMEAPTPVSAYLHSATMVKAGVFLIARLTPVTGMTPLWSALVVGAGAATMILGAYRAVQETDLKRILAYSTLSALGVMTLLLGVGTTAAVGAALAYLAAHAIYKGALFMVAGVIDHEAGTRDTTLLSGLRRVMPLTAFAGGAAALSMAGVPLTLGFVGKEGVYEALLHGGRLLPWLLTLVVVASALQGVSGLLVGMLPFAAGPDGGAVPTGVASAHEPPWGLWLPPLLLACASLLLGLLPSMLNRPLSAAAVSVAPSAPAIALKVWHGVTPALLLSGMTLAAVWMAYRWHVAIRARSWVPRFGTQQLYGLAIAMLDGVSRVIAPPLHSASLRAYVMVIVLTSIVIGGVALITDPALGSVVPKTPVLWHDVPIVLLVIGGALAATQATSTMGAVLSLGAVGYGVAMTFLSFGAPDLAMTQFSVETLTVLIYVLVFRHFRDLGTLSPGLVRLRDGVVAAGIGTLIGGLLLTVATTETAPRLREYFASFGPTLGHGRNIVNVILVDFRAFDTLGEISVLATAALGVRGLLRLASDRRPEQRPVAAVASPVFATAARLLMPLLLLFAVFLLVRGHNEPGGGFVGGLVASAAFVLYGIAFGMERARAALIVRPLTLLGTGLLVALASGVPAVLGGHSFLTAVWMKQPFALGTPAVFDVGVFLVVTGVVLMMVFTLSEEP